MAAITSPGVGSGLDISSLVSQLVAAEGQATTVRLDGKEAKLQATLSAVGSLKGVMSEFQASLGNLKSDSYFDDRTATSEDTKLFTASATASAVLGNYEIEVAGLAKANKVRSTGFTDSSSVVGTGSMTITSGSNSFTLTVDSSSDTLAEIRDAINDSSSNNFVSATIVNVDDGSGGTESRLVLTTKNVGAANALTITVDDDDLNDTDASGLSHLATANLVQLDPAQDAVVKIDGQAVTRSSNTISDAIDGVTLELLTETETPGTTTGLTIGTDTASVFSSVASFVTSYNKMIEVFNQLSSYDPTTGVSGTLFGDATLRSIENQVRREITNTVDSLNGSITNLVDIGITTTDSGALKLDSTILKGAISDNMDDLAKLFSSEDGIATRLDSLVDSYVKSTGVLGSRTSSLNDQVQDITEQRIALENRLASLESRLLAQFTALDTLVSQLNSTSTYLSQQLANLPGAYSPSN